MIIIARLLLNNCLQTLLAELKGLLRLKWKQGKDMPFSTSSPQAIVIGDNVYVGGGWTGQKTMDKGKTVMVYSLDTELWSTLPPYKSYFFGMAMVNNQLVLVGGPAGSYTTNMLGVWDEVSKTWTYPFPKMPTSRHSPSVISYQKWLIVAGGNYGFKFSNKVELLDTLSGQWYEGPPLPSGCSEMSSAINGNMWYLSGRFSSQGVDKQVFSMSLDELISQAILHTTGGATSCSTPSPWQTLTDSPLAHSNALVVNGALLAVGGSRSSAIHHYQPSSKSWVKVGDLPTRRWMCACTVLPNGEIFVAGGLGENNHHVYIGTISF